MAVFGLKIISKFLRKPFQKLQRSIFWVDSNYVDWRQKIL